jgi:small-conductance mechanosensitive channel
MSAAQVIEVLDQTVDWYRTLGMQQQVATEPSDQLILYDNRQTANKVIALAFDIARANADILGSTAAATVPDAGDPALSAQSIGQIRTKLEAQGHSIETELAAVRGDLAAGKAARSEHEAKIRELQGELDLVNTKKGIVATMADITTGASGTSAGSLKAQIDAMAVAIPAAAPATAAAGGASAGGAPNAGAATAGPPAAAANAGPTFLSSAAGERFGLWDQAASVFRLSEKASTITSIDRRTAALQATLAALKQPLIERIKALSARGDALASQADSADSTTLNGVHDQLDSLAGDFKQISGLLLPLTRESLLLAQYRRNLGNWRTTIETQYRDALKVLGIRFGLVFVVLAVVFAGAELWRRTVLRYIQDGRRRYQLLLLRRIALWSLVVIVIGIAFASELGSIVTFAGLITAGIAVAMQSVLVSIVGYFFLIGKYGIRVGDRVQIGEVAGEVIDLGLVRMYLMELGAKGTMGPTGRVVAFANSVVFQVASGLFKQIPGVNLTWRDITLNVPATADYAAIKDKLTAALTQSLADYRGEIDRQSREIERTTATNTALDVRPQVQLRFSGAGVEAHVRYPVHLQHAAEIDERVTEALARVLADAAT